MIKNFRGFLWNLTVYSVALAGCQPLTTISPSSFPGTHNFSSQGSFAGQQVSLAVLPFENVSRQSHLTWLRRGLQEMLVSDLAQWPQFQVISRDALGPVLREQWLQQRGFSSLDDAVRVGQLKGVRYLIQGRMYSLDEVLSVDLQIVDVETGVVVGSAQSQGSESDISHVAGNLVSQVVRLFETPNILKDRSRAVEQGQDLSPSTSVRGNSQKPDDEDFLHVQFPAHFMDKIDAVLTTEKLLLKKFEILRLVEKIWNEGWSFEMGQPFYDRGEGSHPFIRSVTILNIPTSLSFSSSRLTEIFAQLSKLEAHPDVQMDADGLHINVNNTSEDHQVFIEQFSQPRRVFVRALNEQGDVLAIFSEWGWRTNGILHRQDSHTASIPLSPKTFIRGLAKFPAQWIEWEGSHVSFDVVVSPIQDEQVIVKLEVLRESDDIGVHGTGNGYSEEMGLQEKLEELIRVRWTPPISEGLPGDGYLPGNKRTADGLVETEEGRIVRVQFHNVPNDPLFLKSVEQLRSNLLDTCILCINPETFSNSLVLSQTFRLQLTLVKDTHSLKLGPSSP